MLAFGVIRVLEPDGLAGIDEDAVGLIDPDSGRITTQYRVGHSPQAVAAGAGSVWVANRLDGTVSRIDRERSERGRSTSAASRRGLAFGAGSLWVADGEGRKVAQIAPQTQQGRAADRDRQRGARRRRRLRRGLGRVRGRRHDRADRREERQAWPADPGPGPAVGAGGGRGRDLGRERRHRARRQARPSLGHAAGRAFASATGPARVAVGAGAVWVANRSDGTVSRIDPDSEVTETVRVGREPRAVAADRDGVWVADAGDGTGGADRPRAAAG